jgi:hypothetical protein
MPASYHSTKFPADAAMIVRRRSAFEAAAAMGVSVDMVTKKFVSKSRIAG